MTPQKLTVQAFGPYVAAQTLDFTQLNSPIFLIYGDTGSGKSAILDAITFALYGKSSGGGRDDLEQMRCKSAPRELDTVVEFTFLSRGKLYKFERKLVCQKKGSSYNKILNVCHGDGEKWHAFFANPKLKDLEEKATEITGLTYEQFRQVIILPQGQFENLLVAHSKEKQEILRTLFGTQKYDIVAQKICEKANQMSAELRLIKTRQEELLASCESNSLAELIEHIEAKQAEHTALGQELRALNVQGLEQKLAAAQKLYDLFSELKNVEQEIVELKKYEQVIAQAQEDLDKALRADVVNTHYLAYLAADKRLKQREQKLIDLKLQIEVCGAAAEKWQAEHKKYMGLEDVSGKLAELESLKTVYAGLAQAQALCAQKKSRLSAAQKEHTGAQSRYAQLKEKLESDTRLKQSLFEEYVSKIPEYKMLAKTREQQKRLTSGIQTRAAKIARLQSELGQLQGEHQRRAEQYERLYKDFLGSTAYLLAQGLQEGQPCPVCGSTHHVAQPTAHEQVSQAQISELAEQRDALYEKLQNTQAQLIAQQRQMDADKAELEQLCVDADIEQTLKEALEKEKLYVSIDIDEKAAQQAQAGLDAAREALADAQNAHASSLAKLETLREQKREGIQDLEQLNAQIVECARQKENREKNIAHAQEEYEKANLKFIAAQTSVRHEQGERQIAQAETDSALELLEQAIHSQHFAGRQEFLNALMDAAKKEKYVQKIQSYKDKSYHLSETRQKLAQGLHGKTQPDVQTMQKSLELAQQKQSELIHKKAQAQALLEVWQKHRQTLEQLSAEHEQTFKTYLKLSDFGKLLRGDSGISLERYVLGVMLNAVTYEANKLLRHVHGGRFQLFRSVKKQGRQRHTGLELEVLDAYSGQVRPVAGLSGGEKFLVATALSLGLSLVVQTQSGGLKIDTMFIDEGFGSLDNSSIDDELYILSIGGCRVGMISHVAALKENIPCAIEVKKKSSGSEIKIIN